MTKKIESFCKLTLCVGMLFSVGCAVSRAVLVEQRYAPEKGGTVRLEWNAFAQPIDAHLKAKELIGKFCAPLRPKVLSVKENRELVRVDTLGTTTAYNTPVGGGLSYSNYDSSHSTRPEYQNKPLVQFVCEAPPSEQKPAGEQ